LRLRPFSIWRPRFLADAVAVAGGMAAGSPADDSPSESTPLNSGFENHIAAWVAGLAGRCETSLLGSAISGFELLLGACQGAQVRFVWVRNR
jgi:hypothetical protein